MADKEDPNWGPHSLWGNVAAIALIVFVVWMVVSMCSQPKSRGRDNPMHIILVPALDLGQLPDGNRWIQWRPD